MFERNNKKVGYIYLSTFSKTSASQVRKSLSKLESEGMESLIIDVRSNTGGYLESADAILNMFIKKVKFFILLKIKMAIKKFMILQMKKETMILLF